MKKAITVCFLTCGLLISAHAQKTTLTLKDGRATVKKNFAPRRKAAAHFYYLALRKGQTAALTVTPAAAAPSNLTASTGSVGRIDLKWADNSNNETGFRIERCPGTACTNFTLLTTVGARTTSYRNSSLPAGTSYTYRVRANTSAGYSVYSNVATGRTR